jgi:hypothetical protein
MSLRTPRAASSGPSGRLNCWIRGLTSATSVRAPNPTIPRHSSQTSAPKSTVRS